MAPADDAMPMLVSLTAAGAPDAAPASAVGGKASSLARLYAIPAVRERGRVPRSYALSAAFFRPWSDALMLMRADGEDRAAAADDDDEARLREACDGLKRACLDVPLNVAQRTALESLSASIADEFDRGLAAVRSSGVEEDGSDASYAGIFETELGVTPGRLEGAVRRCFASRFDYRALRYGGVGGGVGGVGVGAGGGFAVVVMEMIDSAVAGVAFSANPLNSDRDECVVDASYGLGESVVDGSVTADRFVYDKVRNEIVERVIGSKRTERRLNFAEEGGVTARTIEDEARQGASSLSDERLEELARLACVVEEAYGAPVDVEWAYADDGALVLLQARPITTLFSIDDAMMTEPTERRVLYYDYNIASEATTTTPFRHMDMTLYCRLSGVIGGIPDVAWPKDPRMPIFTASTRQYVNLSAAFKFLSTEVCARESELLDPYLSSLFASRDCDRDRYRADALPEGASLRNLLWLCRQFPFVEYYAISRRYDRDPARAKEDYLEILKEDMSNIAERKRRGYKKEEGLRKYFDELLECLMPSITQEMAVIMFGLLGTWRALDKERREGETEETRSDADALCGGYEGDELMQINIGVYNLANKLDQSFWDEYDHDKLHLLAKRIEENLDGTLSDLPKDFLSAWTQFMERFGWDGEDQMFISSPRYQDDPELLLARMRLNVGTGITDPTISLQEKVDKRREIAKKHEEKAASKWWTSLFALSRVRKRNAYLEHLMWIRNSPKIHISAVMGALRTGILRAEQELIDAKRLDCKNDIFHLDLEDVDKAFADESYDLMELVRPRKTLFERAIRAKECPLLVDSRCRILRPDPPSREDAEEGTIVGSAVSPGTATGRVRIMTSPAERFEQGEVLAATVTSPAWTPLFVGASAVVLQIGGALQHGALCAREFGKPAVSNIDIHNVLKTGMLVTVDGNTGTVKIIDES